MKKLFAATLAAILILTPERAAADVAALLRQMDEHGFLEP